MRRLAAVASAALALTLTGCSDDTGTPARSSAAPNTSASQSGASPFVVAAAAVATRSREQVVALHAWGTATTVDGGIPHTELPARGVAIRSALTTQISDATRLPPPAGSPAAALVSALRSYDTLAGRLADWDPSGAQLPPQWFATLRSTDASWRAAVARLSTASGRNLLAGLPTLTLPAS